MQDLFDELLATTALPLEVIVARLVGALVLCGLIGFERETRQRPAGLRTHMLVGLAAALYTLIMLEALVRSQAHTGQVAMDPLRLIEAVTSGVAFLAAGMIVFSQGKVRGLTTGTSLWLAAAIGLSAGWGMWSMALATTVLALIVIRLIKIAEEEAGGKPRDKD
ncbi:putative Mg2+ transporter-C (MgtC) family protein [Lutimaribacter pacificus]|uniref:Protein MgtC n=1 Tax=Lutimaribacter pacificus TaxID=391948 RepID=A0A1H0M5V3_9RHOB|nr:MgtC/SapB family protein [Lutimaribacter pacificus]SDO75747.1 putative Mg2+ transporter-C (MgtC) family protein [Lutimaribacter pacificus]SHK78063.1 putative Mg2+ transporter-C (MgtC) family protein [Lutimaribacter pacificus]